MMQCEFQEYIEETVSNDTARVISTLAWKQLTYTFKVNMAQPVYDFDMTAAVVEGDSIDLYGCDIIPI